MAEEKKKNSSFNLKLLIIFLSPVILILSIIWGYATLYSKKTFFMSHLNIKQSVIEKPQGNNVHNLLDKNGRLAYAGWSPRPYDFHFNIFDESYKNSMNSLIHTFRYRKWESLVFSSADYIFYLHFFDYKFVGGYSIDIVKIDKNQDSKKKRHIHKGSYYSFLYGPAIENNCNKRCNAFNFTNSNMDISYNKTNHNSHKMSLNYNKDNVQLNFKINLVYKAHGDSMVSVSPINAKKNYFTAGAKTNLISPKGSLVFNGNKLNGEDFSVTYVSNRGIYPTKTRMIWANGNGQLKTGKKIGLNFGYGSQHFNRSMHTEDAFYIEGIIYKLNAVNTEPNYIIDEQNKRQVEWSFYNFDDDYNDKGVNYCDVVFTSQVGDIENFGILGNQISLNTYYGVFKGLCKDYNGNEHEFEDVYGLVEDRDLVW